MLEEVFSSEEYDGCGLNPLEDLKALRLNRFLRVLAMLVLMSHVGSGLRQRRLRGVLASSM